MPAKSKLMSACPIDAHESILHILQSNSLTYFRFWILHLVLVFSLHGSAVDAGLSPSDSMFFGAHGLTLQNPAFL